MKVPLYLALGTALRDIKQLHLETLPMPADANYYINTKTRTQKYHAVISCMEQVSSTQKVNNMQSHSFSLFPSILKSLRNDDANGGSFFFFLRATRRERKSKIMQINGKKEERFGWREGFHSRSSRLLRSLFTCALKVL